MAKKVIQGNFHVTVHRDGENKSVKPGEVFDFTKEELADIIAVHGEDSLRNPVNEVNEVAEATPAKGKGKGKAEGAADSNTESAGGSETL